MLSIRFARRFVLLSLLSCLSSLAVGQDNRGPQGVPGTSLPPNRNVMDRLYDRQDGVQNSTIRLYGDPNSLSTYPTSDVDREIRLYKASDLYMRIYLGAHTAGDAGIMDIVSPGVGPNASPFIFRVKGADVMQTTLRQGWNSGTFSQETLLVGDDSAGTGEGVLRTTSIQIAGDSDQSATFYFGPAATLTLGLPVPCTIYGTCSWEWRFGQAPISKSMGKTSIRMFWSGTEFVQEFDMRAITDPNTSGTYRAVFNHQVAINNFGFGKRITTTLKNATWTIGRTDTAGTADVLCFYENGYATSAWCIDKDGNWLNKTGTNTIDGVDIAAHDHSQASGEAYLGDDVVREQELRVDAATYASPPGTDGVVLAFDSGLTATYDLKWADLSEIAGTLADTQFDISSVPSDFCLQILYGHGTPNTGADRYFKFGEDNPSPSGSYLPSFVGMNAGYTMFSLRVEVDTAPGAGNNWTFTLMKNGTTTALTCPITDTSTNCFDNTHSVSLTLWDNIGLKAAPGTGTEIPSGSGDMRFAICLAP